MDLYRALRTSAGDRTSQQSETKSGEINDLKSTDMNKRWNRIQTVVECPGRRYYKLQPSWGLNPVLGQKTLPNYGHLKEIPADLLQYYN